MGDYKHEKMINAEFVWFFIILIEFMVLLIMVAPITDYEKVMGFIGLHFLIIFILATQWQNIKRVIKMAVD